MKQSNNRRNARRMAACGGAAIFLALAAASAQAADAPPFPGKPDKPPERIVSMVPHITEMLFALGVGGRVVGVGEGCLWPEEAKALPNVGGALEPEPNVGKIVELKPDLVFLTRSHALYYQELEKRKIPTLTVNTDSIAGALWTLRALAEIMDRVEQAKPLAEKMVKELNLLYKENEAKDAKRTLLSLGHESRSLDIVLAAAPDNYIGEILRIAGGDNIVGPAKTKEDAALVKPLTAMEIRDAKPEIIIDQVYGEPLDPAETRRREAMWRELFSATDFRPRRVYVIDDPYLGVPGIHIADSIRKLRGLIHYAGE